MASELHVTAELTALLDYAMNRTLDRLAGVTDSEYLWEPVPDCMTLHPDGPGAWRADERRPADTAGPEPMTTIAWRIWHIGAGSLRGFSERFFGAEPGGAEPDRWPGTAAEGVAELREQWGRFRERLATYDDRALAGPLGPTAGPYAEDTYLALVLHVLDEVIHHGAEIGVLRDLYLHNFTAGARLED